MTTTDTNTADFPLFTLANEWAMVCLFADNPPTPEQQAQIDAARTKYLECVQAARATHPPTNTAPREPRPDDLLTVANIELDGQTLTLLLSDLGGLECFVGEAERTYTMKIAAMRRDEFEALGEFNGF